jgi:hypothetical protein
MPQLVKGGKWVFGWVIVGGQGELVIPHEALDEYGFQPGEVAVFLQGSQSSGGFGLSSPRLLAKMGLPLRVRTLARGSIGEDGQIVLPPALAMRPGARLLAVKGSGRALGFVARGLIYDEALLHPGLDVLRSPSLLR